MAIVPRHVLGAGQEPPSEKVRLAAIGCGGKGGTDINESVKAGAVVTALCDADERRASGMYRRYPKVPKYTDFRKMLDEMDKSIDAVTVSTPDHMHFHASYRAICMGKHCFTQKPLTHSVWESRQLTLAARKHKVATQMGIQGHASEKCPLLREFLEAGAVGNVREVHIWTNRPIWPQGHERPKGSLPVPKGLDWEMWLGPAPHRPFNDGFAKWKGGKVGYLPFHWRGWWDFGTGALGDIACHAFDHFFWAYQPPHPVTVEAKSSGHNHETYPLWSEVAYEFPANGDKPAFKLVWYDGGKKPPRPEALEKGRDLPSGGRIIIGDKGVLYGTRLVPEEKMKAFLETKPERKYPRSIGHYKEWIEACKGGKPAGANFDFAGPLSETVLMGNLAVATGKKVEWDGKNMKCTNIPEANKYVRREYRKGWEVDL